MLWSTSLTITVLAITLPRIGGIPALKSNGSSTIEAAANPSPGNGDNHHMNQLPQFVPLPSATNHFADKAAVNISTTPSVSPFQPPAMSATLR